MKPCGLVLHVAAASIWSARTTPSSFRAKKLISWDRLLKDGKVSCARGDAPAASLADNLGLASHWLPAERPG